MNRFLKHLALDAARRSALTSLLRRRLLILSRGCAEEALAWTKAAMTRPGLTLNEAKISVKDARQELFDFLGYELEPRHLRAGGGDTSAQALPRRAFSGSR